MSLTSYLTDPAHPNLREKFRTEFRRPLFNLKCEIRAEPLTKNYGIVGTAFDYLLRFTIQMRNKEKCANCEKWVADQAFRTVEKSFEGRKKLELQNRFNRAKENYATFIVNGKLTDHLLADTLLLAKLDLYVRYGMIAPDLFIESNLDIEDLRNLHSAINIKDFVAKKICLLNPTFGIGSLIVGGADADIILDDTLIDIKVTKHLKLEREYISQLLGYYILALIGGINKDCSGITIKNIGIYFARHGLMWTVPLLELGDDVKFNSFKDWFFAYFENLKSKKMEEINEQLEQLKKQMENQKKAKTIKTRKASL